jgi:hypothetical protein
MNTRYQSEAWEQARAATLSRDRGRCQDCGVAEDIHVHHIKPIRDFEHSDDAHFVENLVTLCESCHPKWEGVTARPNLLDAGGDVHLSELVHNLSKDTIERLLEPAGPWMLYEFYSARIAGDGSVCDFCFSRSQTSRGHCAECGREMSLWKAYDHTPPDETGMKRRVGRLADALERHGIPVDYDAMQVVVRRYWSDPDWYGEIEDVTDMAAYVGIHRGHDPDEVDVGHGAICPEPSPTV